MEWADCYLQNTYFSRQNIFLILNFQGFLYIDDEFMRGMAWQHIILTGFFLRPVVKTVETGGMLKPHDDSDARSIIIAKMVIH